MYATFEASRLLLSKTAIEHGKAIAARVPHVAVPYAPYGSMRALIEAFNNATEANPFKVSTLSPRRSIFTSPDARFYFKLWEASLEAKYYGVHLGGLVASSEIADSVDHAGASTLAWIIRDEAKYFMEIAGEAPEDEVNWAYAIFLKTAKEANNEQATISR